MLYQLAMYALSTPSPLRRHPVPDHLPGGQRAGIAVRASGSRQALVALRPVHVDCLAALIDPSAPPAPSAALRRRRKQYARYLAFSRSPPA
ncbi:MAG: hypothetical protein AB1503_12115 [Bacillota bacterium]